MKLLKALIVEDSEDDALILLRHLKRSGYEIEYQRVQSGGSMQEALTSHDWQIVLSDYSMPQFDGLMALAILKNSGRDIPFIMISGTIGEDTAVQAMLAGVDDYFVKGNLNRLGPAIERELKEAENRNARRQAEQDLDLSKKRLQLALNAAGMGVWEWNLENDEVYWSPECYEIYETDKSIESLAGFVAFVHPEDLPTFMNASREAIENHENFHAEFRIIKETGEISWLANFGKCEYGENGKPLRLIGTVQNITERKKSETALRESEENLRAITEASTQYIFTASEDGSSAELFRWFSILSGRNINDLTDLVELVHPDDLEYGTKAWAEAIEKKTVYHGTTRYLTKTGDYCYLATRSVPMFNNDGTFRQWIGSFNDITEQKHAEDELRKSEERFRSLINSTTQIVWTADADGNLLSALTPEGEAVEDAGEDLMNAWITRLHPGDSERVMKEYGESIRTKKKYKAEYRMLHKDGTYHYYIARGTPIYEKDGTVREWVGTITDVTKNKLAEENLRKSEEQLRQAQKLESVGRLAGGIAHDFNNMLTAINGYSDLALRRLGENDPLRRNLEEIKKAGERSASLTQQLLAFSRRTILQIKVLDINQIVSDSIIMFQRLIGEDIEIVSSLNPRVDQLKADAGQLSQMLLNLVVNARDAMPQGGTITIETDNAVLDENFVLQNAGSKAGNYVKLAVTDTGVGIDEDTRQMIFEPFFTTKEIGKGTGLGLSTVYGIVNQLGGYIAVKSAVDVGTSFEIYLPSEIETEKLAEKRKVQGEVERGIETILLVEDEELVRNLSRQVLETCGYGVIEAKDGFEAIELCHQNGKEIDLLLTDVVMPLMSGRELAEKIKEMKPTIKILFTSGYTEDAVVRHGVSESEMNFIQKPFSFDELAKKVRTLLDEK
jgi:two-component system, cell cycle sensor histidine kinase and response regulator CckA